MSKHPEDLKITNDEGVELALKGELVKSSSKSYHYIMYDPELAAKFDEHETYWDGTFDFRPRIKKVGQFFTIMGMRANVVSLFEQQICVIAIFFKSKKKCSEIWKNSKLFEILKFSNFWTHFSIDKSKTFVSKFILKKKIWFTVLPFKNINMSFNGYLVLTYSNTYWKWIDDKSTNKLTNLRNS